MNDSRLQGIAPAFLKYLKYNCTELEAAQHVWECMSTGAPGNEAWKLWIAIHGDKAFSVSDVDIALKEIVKAIQAI